MSAFGAYQTRHEIEAVTVRLQIDIIISSVRPGPLGLGHCMQQAVIQRDSDDPRLHGRIDGRQRDKLISKRVTAKPR